MVRNSFAPGRRILTCVVLAAAAVTACTSVKPTQRTFEGTSWRVVAINGSTTPWSEHYKVRFEAGRIGGRFGCNQFGGPYRVEGGFLIAEGIASTLLGCPEPAATHEIQGLAVLARPMRMQWESARRLALTSTNGSIALEQISETPR